ncbi:MULTISPECIES: hypothetical protein [unclassified Streptomyces]|uniref:hypothetical protein n=1 Tax=unclassified Streptomyces TaxID=2593676 RepID=UPI00131A5C46|nr:MULTISPECIES: hypothetical protein [unclassified Streptomyces]
MKITKLVKIAAGGLAVLALSVSFALGAGAASERSLDSSVSVQSGGHAGGAIDWP